MEDKGRCEHGEFVISEGCPLCIAEFQSDRPMEIPEMPQQAETAIVKVAPGKDSAVQALLQEVLGIQKYAQDRLVLSVEDMKAVTNDLAIIGSLKKRIMEKQREYLEPIKQHVTDVANSFKLLLDPLAVADNMLREKAKEYDAKQQAIRAEQERINRLRIEAAQAEQKLKGEITESVNLVEVQAEPPKHYRSDVGTLGKVDHWKVEVLDFSALPDEYKIPDYTKLNKVVRAGLHKILGCRIWNDPDMRVRQNK